MSDAPAETDAPGEMDTAVKVFTAVKPRLFGIAYRMLGSVAEAEDLVQEAWIRWQNYDRSTVREPAAFLSTTVTRLAITYAQSARVRRESYVGPWLPEPVDTSADPALGAERAEALDFAMLMLLEKLSPTERAAYVLREAFDYPYDQIAEIVQQTQTGARQLVSRARKRLGSERRQTVTAAEQRRLLDAFVLAAQAGDLAALEELLAADVVSYSDGGGVVRASRFPVVGIQRVSLFVRAFSERFWGAATIENIEVNGQAAVRLSSGNKTFAVVTLSASPAGVYQLLWMMNPGKLRRFA